MPTKPAEPNTDDLTVTEVMGATGLKRSSVYWRISKGLFASHWHGGKVRVPRWSVDRYLAERASKAA